MRKVTELFRRMFKWRSQVKISDADRKSKMPALITLYPDEGSGNSSGRINIPAHKKQPQAMYDALKSTLQDSGFELMGP